MPSIPLYGYDQLDPSVLNNAKRRIVGLMDTSQEALTEKPDKDPTGGKQNGFVEKLTEEIYATIKDIEVLDSYISDTSAITELRVLNRTDKSSLKSLRAELKKGASQIASINNDLRRINATYDRLRTNMVYTDLKIFTFFTNAVKILKQSALTFFNIVDNLIEDVIKTEDPTSTYVKPPINEDDEDIEAPPIEAELSTSGVPLGELSNEPEPIYSPTPIPGPDPPTPPPPRKPYRGNFGKKMKEYQALIAKLIQDNNILDQNDADLITKYALDYVRANTAFLTEPEIQDFIDRVKNPPQLPIAPIAPSTETFSDMVDRITANLSTQEQIEVGKNIATYINQFQREPTELEVQDIITQVINPKGSSSSSNQPPIVTGVPQPTQGVPIGITGVPSNLLTGTPIPQDYADLRVRADVLKGDKDLTNQIGRNALIRTEGVIDEAIAKNKDFKATLNKYRKLIEYGEEPFLTYTTPLPPITKQERATLNGLATDYKQEKKKLTMKDKNKWRDAYKAFMVANNIPFTPSP